MKSVPIGRGLPMKPARAAAVVTWVYAAGFGIPTVPVAVFLLTQGRLPSFLGLFDMYGGPWSPRLEPEKFVALLGAFLGVTGVAPGQHGGYGAVGRLAQSSTSLCFPSRRSSGLASLCRFPGRSGQLELC